MTPITRSEVFSELTGDDVNFQGQVQYHPVAQKLTILQCLFTKPKKTIVTNYVISKRNTKR